MKIATALILWVVLATPAITQPEQTWPSPEAKPVAETISVNPWEGQPQADSVEQEQVVFQLADSAEVAPYGDDGRVMILSVGLDAKKSYGVRLTPSVEVAWIEVHDADNPFPPRVQKPQNGKFVISGNPGQVFWVSLRSGVEPPAWVTVTVGGDSGGTDPPVDPPVGDYSGLTEISRARANALGDAATAANIKKAINDACAQLKLACDDGNCPVLSAAKQTVVRAIDDAKKDGRVDWYGGWRVPISEAIGSLGITTTPEYIAAMRAVAEGL